MIEAEAERLREERRAKMKEIKENMSNGLWRDGVTSAPDVREVDEFHEELSAAEKRLRRSKDNLVKGKSPIVPKDKLHLSKRNIEKVISIFKNSSFFLFGSGYLMICFFIIFRKLKQSYWKAI